MVASYNRREFDRVLGKLIERVPDWIIEKTDSNLTYIKIRRPGGHRHSTEGAGEGLLNLMSIADALYDSNPEDVIAIDEPELSLHPAGSTKTERDARGVLKRSPDHYSYALSIFRGSEVSM